MKNRKQRAAQWHGGMMVRRVAWAASIAGLCLCGTVASADPITMTGSDSFSASSFTSGTRWSDGQIPHADADYVVSGSYTMRTPDATGNYTFAGKSLTLDGSARAAGSPGTGILFKGTSNPNTITINDLRMNNERIQGANNGNTNYLAGNITLLAGGGYFTNGNVRGKTYLSAHITGVGSLTFTESSAMTYITEGLFLTAANDYSGGTTVGNFGQLHVTVDSGLGSGNVTVLPNGRLILESAANDNYIADAASLILNTGAAMQLNFTGFDQISALSLDGGLSWAAAGTWGAIGSSADHTSSLFTGAGLLQVIPEPAALVLLGIGGLTMLCQRTRRA